MRSYAPDALIYPRVKNIIARIAHVALIACWGSAIAALATLLPMPLSYFLLLCELNLIFQLLLGICLGLLLPWCHYVLLSQSGLALTRALSLIASFLALLSAVSYLYTLLTGSLLLQLQASAPVLMGLIAFPIMVLNLGYLGALRPLLRAALILLPLLYIFSYVGAYNYEQFSILVSTPILLLCAHPLLLGLKRLAPRVISLPESR